MGTQDSGIRARDLYIKGQTKKGSSIVIWHETDEVWDESFDNIITPAINESYPQKGFVKSVATDKILAKLTDNEKQSYSLYLKFQSDLLLNKKDFRIEHKGLKYAITFIDAPEIQDIVYKYEVLLAR